jgi:hypothetical protein
MAVIKLKTIFRFSWLLILNHNLMIYLGGGETLHSTATRERIHYFLLNGIVLESLEDIDVLIPLETVRAHQKLSFEVTSLPILILSCEL